MLVDNFSTPASSTESDEIDATESDSFEYCKSDTLELFFRLRKWQAVEAIKRKQIAPTATIFLFEDIDLIMILVVLSSGCAADGIDVGALDRSKLGMTDGIALGYSLGKEDGSELGESVGAVDVEGANDGLVDGEVLKVGCSDGWLLGEFDMVGLRDGLLDGDVDVVGCIDG